MTATNLILTEQARGILTIGLDRPDKKNAITHAMYLDMTRALKRAAQDPDVRVVLIRGTNEVFCAGNDLTDFNRRKEGEPSPGSLFLKALSVFKKPVVAAVAGLAIGVGATLLLHCDLVYAARDTRFCMPFINLGLCPEAGSTWILPARAGYLRAARVLMLGDFFDAETAVELGLVTVVLPANTLMPQAIKDASRLAQKPLEALLQTKQLMKEGTSRLIGSHMDLEFKAFGRLLASEESKKLRAKHYKEKNDGS